MKYYGIGRVTYWEVSIATWPKQPQLIKDLIDHLVKHSMHQAVWYWCDHDRKPILSLQAQTYYVAFLITIIHGWAVEIKMGTCSSCGTFNKGLSHVSTRLDRGKPPSNLRSEEF